MENLGIVLALGAALCWGTYAVPFKKSKSDDFMQFQFWTGLGIFISGFIISVIANYPLNFNLYGLVSGVLWGIATILFLISILNLGISRSVPIVASLVILATFMWGVLFFKELSSGFIIGLTGIGGILVGVILVSTTQNSQSENTKRGLGAAVLSGVIYGSHLVPIKVTNLASIDFFFSISLGIFLTTSVAFLISGGKLGKKLIKMGFLSGIIWNTGNLLALISISFIGLAKGIPITQSSILVAVLWGLFYFKEVSGFKKKMQILLGAIILLLGIIILSQA